MSIERTEKEPITSREIIFRESELSENRWVWNGVETGNPLWINYIFSYRTGEADLSLHHPFHAGRRKQSKHAEFLENTCNFGYNQNKRHRKRRCGL